MLLHSDGEEEGAVGYGADVESEAVVGGMVAGKLVGGGILHCRCVFGCKDTMISYWGHLILEKAHANGRPMVAELNRKHWLTGLTQRAQRGWGR